MSKTLTNRVQDLVSRVRNFGNAHDHSPIILFSYLTGEMYSIVGVILYPVRAWNLTGARLATHGNLEIAEILWRTESQRDIALQGLAVQRELANPLTEWEQELLAAEWRDEETRIAD